MRKYILTPKQAEWIQAFVELDSVKKAAAKVGVPYPTACDWKKMPAIKREIKFITDRLRKKTGATLEGAINEVDEAITFSRQTENANAYVRALEHKHRLQGFVEDGKQGGAAGAQFNLQIIGVRPEQNEQINVRVLPDNTTPTEQLPDTPELPQATRNDDEKQLEELGL